MSSVPLSQRLQLEPHALCEARNWTVVIAFLKQSSASQQHCGLGRPVASRSRQCHARGDGEFDTLSLRLLYTGFKIISGPSCSLSQCTSEDLRGGKPKVRTGSHSDLAHRPAFSPPKLQDSLATRQHTAPLSTGAIALPRTPQPLRPVVRLHQSLCSLTNHVDIDRPQCISLSVVSLNIVRISTRSSLGMTDYSKRKLTLKASKICGHIAEECHLARDSHLVSHSTRDTGSSGIQETGKTRTPSRCQ